MNDAGRVRGQSADRPVRVSHPVAAPFAGIDDLLWQFPSESDTAANIPRDGSSATNLTMGTRDGMSASGSAGVPSKAPQRSRLALRIARPSNGVTAAALVGSAAAVLFATQTLVLRPASSSAPTAIAPAAAAAPDASRAPQSQAAVAAGRSRDAQEGVAAEPTAPKPVATTSVPAVVEAAAPRPTAAPVMPERSAATRLAIDTVLTSYTSFYSTLDARGVATVQRGIDVPKLSRTFAAVKSQRMTFDRCAVDVRAGDALAYCTGQLQTVLKWRPRSTKTRQQTWDFRLVEQPDGWMIDRVTTR